MSNLANKKLGNEGKAAGPQTSQLTPQKNKIKQVLSEDTKKTVFRKPIREITPAT